MLTDVKIKKKKTGEKKKNWRSIFFFENHVRWKNRLKNWIEEVTDE